MCLGSGSTNLKGISEGSVEVFREVFYELKRDLKRFFWRIWSEKSFKWMKISRKGRKWVWKIEKTRLEAIGRSIRRLSNQKSFKRISFQTPTILRQNFTQNKAKSRIKFSPTSCRLQLSITNLPKTILKQKEKTF